MKVHIASASFRRREAGRHKAETPVVLRVDALPSKLLGTALAEP